MDTLLKETLWKQFGAAIDMLENALILCPDDLWDSESKFWYKAYHTLFYLDYYLTPEPEKFLPPLPFSLTEFDPEEIMPERTYTKEELLNYLNFSRNKCHNIISGLTKETSASRWINEYKNYSMIEVLIYNMRHVQHHTGKLNLLLRQSGNEPPDWVSQTKAEMG